MVKLEQLVKRSSRPDAIWRPQGRVCGRFLRYSQELLIIFGSGLIKKIISKVPNSISTDLSPPTVQTRNVMSKIPDTKKAERCRVDF